MNKISALVALLVAGWVSSCADGPAVPGPLDGTYVMTAWTCGGTDVMAFLTGGGGTVTQIKVFLTGSNGRTEVTYSTGCLRTQPLSAAYPSDTTVTLSDTMPSCTGTCTNECTGYLSATSTYAHSGPGATVTITRTLSSGDIAANDVLQAALCNTSDVETRTLVK